MFRLLETGISVHDKNGLADMISHRVVYNIVY